MLVPFKPDPAYYQGIFASQVGHGHVVRYRGSNLQNGSGFFSNLFTRFVSFAKPLLKSAMPHAKAAFEAAKPHLTAAATGIAKEATSRAAETISKRLSGEQSGSGKRKRRTIAKSKSSRHKKHRSLPPYNIPDVL